MTAFDNKMPFDAEANVRHDENRKALLRDKVFEYDYGPLGDRLKPGAKLHDDLVKYGIDVATRGFSAIMPYHSMWREADWKATGYVKEQDANPRRNSKDKRRNIIVPLTFRMEEMYCSAAHAIFNQDPMFKWKPYPGLDSLINAATMEYMVQRHVLWGKAGLHNDSVTRAAFRYGIGMAGLKWKTKRARRPVDIEITDTALSMFEKQTGTKLPKKLRNQVIRDMEERVIREYSEIQPWDPYSSFYDPTVTPNNFDEADYVGTCFPTNSTQVLAMERENPKQWFNGWYLKVLAESGYAWSQFNKREMSGRDTRQGTTSGHGSNGEPSVKYMAPCDVLYIALMLIPSDWGIGEETWPCRYFMAIGGDEILIGFGRVDRDHGGGDELIMSPNADGFTFAPISHILTTFGIHEHVDEIMQCTSVSMRQNVNGGWTIFNHNVLNWDDFVDGDNVGQVIRPIVASLSRDMMESALKQIPHMDNTPQHMAYIEKMMGMASEGNGTVDIGGPGALVGSERPTKFGMQMQAENTSSRFKRLAFKMGQQYYTELGWKMAHNLVQFGNEPMTVDLAGRFADRIRKQYGIPATQMSFLVDPKDVTLDFEMEPYSGAMPQQKDLSFITQILMGAAGSNPEIAAEMYDGFPSRAVLNMIARESGLENIDDYPEHDPQGGMEQVNMQAMPDEMLAQEVQAGNLAPIGAMQGAY
jgi:hypothetical protein